MLVEERPNDPAVWSRAGSFTWKQFYARANQYGQYFLSQGVKPDDLVALFMIHAPDFRAAWSGLFSVGASPALINCHLTSKALLHCLDISTAKLVLVDGGPDIQGRIDNVRPELEAKGYTVARFEYIWPIV